MFNFLRRRKQPRVFVIGLDCAAPELVFDTWRDRLPNLRRLMENGIYGEFFTENYPARSAVQVARLPKDGLVEIEAVALLD